MFWNLVSFPAGVVPFGRESGKNFDSYDDEGDVALKMARKVSAPSTVLLPEFHVDTIIV